MDKQKDIADKTFYYLAFLIVLVYLILGFNLYHSVFFSYDMPRVGLIVQDFLSRGSYITSQYFYSESTWQNVAWGPALVFFYSFLLKISADPIIVSRYLVVLNAFSILALIFFCKKIFSARSGLIAGAFLAFNPYWFVYTRIIYQPSPLTFLFPIAMLLHFGFVRSNKYAIVLLPIVWLSMFQIYIPSLAFILTSALFLIKYINKSNFKLLIIGSIFSLILFIPSIKFYVEKPDYLNKFFSAPKLFTPNEKTYSERIVNVTTSFINIPVGGLFEWHTGGSYNDFFNQNRMLSPKFSIVLSIIFIISFFQNAYLSIKHKDPNRGVIVAWAFSSFWYLILLWTSNLPPRYFLISFPPIMVLIAITINDFISAVRRIKVIKHISIFIPIIIIGYWIVFNIRYDLFIKNYDFPHGWFNDISETPYIYTREALDWVIKDSMENSCQAVISNDINNSNFGLWMEFEYPWRYVYKKSMVSIENEKHCQYYILKKDTLLLKEERKNFGPFVVYKMD